MRSGRLLAGAAFVAVAAGWACPAPVAAAPVAAAATQTEIVVLDDGVDAAQVAADHARRFGFATTHIYRYALKGYAATLSPAQRQLVGGEAGVRFVNNSANLRLPEDRGLRLRSDLVGPGQPQVTSAAIKRIGAPGSSTASGDGKGSVPINVAVVDGGIDAEHPDLNVVGGFNCLDGGEQDWADRDGHGTLVSGVIGARDNSIGLVGVAPGANLFAVRVATSSGSISGQAALCGLDWVAGTRMDGKPGNDVAVANLSFGGQNPGSEFGPGCGVASGDALREAICGLISAGVAPVASAGNAAMDFRSTSPANFPTVLTVTAIADFDGRPAGDASAPGSCFGADDEPASFSNFAVRTQDASHVVAAPGVCVDSTFLGGRYATANGTSFSAPLVTGTVALCIHNGRCPKADPAMAIARVFSDARSFNTANPDYGFVGDPLRPDGNRIYGYLVDASRY
jgi:subtilisin family serine protease